MIKGIAHVAFNVSNMDESLRFYCNILGFTKVFEIRDDAGNPWINYLKVRDGQFIELFYITPEKGPSPYSHLCLEVEDIYAIAAHLKANGIHLDVEPKQGKDTNYQCWVTDPRW